VAGQTINAVSGTTGVLTQSGSLDLVGTITDSRGRTASKTVSITVMNYALPNISSATAVRSSNTGTVDVNGTSIRVDLLAAVQSLIVGTQKNDLTVNIKTKQTDDDTPWSSISPVDTVDAGDVGYNDHRILSTYDTAHSYVVRIEVSDVLGSVSAVEITVGTGGVLIHYSTTEDAMGVGKYWEQGSVDAQGQMYQRAGKRVLDEDDYTELDDTLTELDDTLTELEVGYRPNGAVYFTSSGTFSKTDYPDARAIRVRLVGGGGGSAAAAAASSGNYSIGTGGGGGGYAERFITDIDGLDDSIAVTIGAGGTAGGNSGGQGGTTSFADSTYPVAATGGTGGNIKPNSPYAPYVPGGDGGVGTDGDLLIAGQGGDGGSGNSTLGAGGAGGSSQLGGGAASHGTGAGGGGVNGTPGGNYGGGASGATANAGSGSHPGAAGAPGIVIVELFA
jgi:hypothetical protein